MNNSIWKTPLFQSISLHLVPIAFIGLLLAVKSNPISKKTVKFKIIEKPAVQNKKVEIGISSATKPIKKPQKIIKKKINKVFGASRKSITSTKSTAPVVKQGNTITKEVDQKKLKKDDLDELPIPKAEYLITDMPRVTNQAKIRYPEKAKKIRLEGTVTLSVLIDEKGIVRDAQVIEGLIPEMDQEALRAIKLYEFSPAKIDSKSVPVRINYAINFVLEES